MFPYYNYIYDAITKIIDNYPFLQTDDIVEQLSYQVVSYAYNTYLKFVYPFEFNLAKENNFLKGSTEEEQSLFFRDTLSSNDEWIGENGAFPPTRDGCIHSLSMRKRG